MLLTNIQELATWNETLEDHVAERTEALRQQQVDIAIIETGLGGRLDATNLINPLVSVITNIPL